MTLSASQSYHSLQSLSATVLLFFVVAVDMKVKEFVMKMSFR